MASKQWAESAYERARFGFRSNGLALAGTTGGGVFRASLPVTVATVDDNRARSGAELRIRATATSIAYTLSSAAHVQLSLMDAHGRTVLQLVNAAQAPGRRSVAVDAARLSPGLYAYVLAVDGHRATKRMMVVR
ncbi:MAG: hypothetical protein IPO17_16950 [Flavobacteriales bacterium]|nr:hypothetical protein [Flavobacteriales bacterium]